MSWGPSLARRQRRIKRKRKSRGLGATRGGGRYPLLQSYAKDAGLHVTRWSPGDGVTRYRFFDRPGNSYNGPDNGVCTALGLKSAWKFLQTGTCPRGKSRR